MGPASPTDRLLLTPPERTPPPVGPWTFKRYLIWRLVTAAIILLLALTLIFYALEVVPGDPTRIMLPKGGCATYPPACDLRNQIIHEWGLDRPLWDRYVTFLSNIVQGNLGTSITTNPGTAVLDLIAPRLATTLVLTGATLFLVVLLGLTLGMPLSRRKGRAADSAASLLLALIYSAPIFALSLGMLALLAVAFPVFPLYGTHSLDSGTMGLLGQLADSLWHLALPLLILVLSGLALFVWIVRDYPLRPSTEPSPVPAGDWRLTRPTRSARLRAAAPRFLPTIAALMGWTVTSVLVVDMVFDLQGLGTLLWLGILDLDFMVVTGVLVFVSLLLVLPALVAADAIHYWLTASWVRSDGIRVQQFRVEARDLGRGFRRIVSHPLGFSGLILALVLVGLTAAAPALVGPHPNPSTAGQPLQPPSPDHPLGTDFHGFDILALTLYGGAAGVPMAILAFAVCLIAELGIVAAIGLLGDRVDVLVGLPVDLFLVLPLPFAILLAISASGISFLVFVGLAAWPIPARLLRLELSGLVGADRRPSGSRLSLRARGTRTLSLVWGMGPLILGNAFLGVALALSLWGTMGAIGFATPNLTSWGGMINEWYTSMGMLNGLWDAFLAPFVSLLAAVLAPLLLSLACKSIGPHPAAKQALSTPVLIPETAPVATPPM